MGAALGGSEDIANPEGEARVRQDQGYYETKPNGIRLNCT